MSLPLMTLAGKLGEILARERRSRLDHLIGWARNPLAVLGLAMVASGLCGVYLNARAFVVAAGLAGMVGVGVAWPWFAVRGLSGRLTFGRARVREGEPVPARLVLRNRMPWGAWGLSIRGACHDRSEPGLAHAPGWRTVEASWELSPACRGEFPRATPRVVSAFPFGLWEASRGLEAPERLLVWPKTFPVGLIPETSDGHGSDGLATRNRPGDMGDLLGVRPYRRGDSIRRVHWPQTARHGQLVVCELQSTAVPLAQIVLDAHPDAHVGSEPDGSLEWAVRVAASFAEGWTAQGAEVEIVWGDRAAASGVGTARVRQSRLLDALARLELDGRHPVWDVLEGPHCRRFGQGIRVVITTDIGLGALARPTVHAIEERFVVLRSTAFASDELRDETRRPLPIRPWIEIDDVARIPHLLRTAGKGGSRGS